MPDTTCHMSISLDGFVAGPDQSREDPLGKRGRELHGWHIGDPRANDADKVANEWLMRPRGAYVMGRNMFGPIRGDWDEEWAGWWGAEPPYHAPVFVLTHHGHDSIPSKIRSPEPSRTGAMSRVSSSITPAFNACRTVEAPPAMSTPLSPAA